MPTETNSAGEKMDESEGALGILLRFREWNLHVFRWSLSFCVCWDEKSRQGSATQRSCHPKLCVLRHPLPSESEDFPVELGTFQPLHELFVGSLYFWIPRWYPRLFFSGWWDDIIHRICPFLFSPKCSFAVAGGPTEAWGASESWVFLGISEGIHQEKSADVNYKSGVNFKVNGCISWDDL